MPDYEKLYTTLFNGITDTIEHLVKLQQAAEELYLRSDELRIVKPLSGDKDKEPPAL